MTPYALRSADRDRALAPHLGVDQELRALAAQRR